MLALICVMGETYTYGQNMFSYNPQVRKSHIIDLDNNEKLVLEFASEEMLQHPPSLDSILRNFMHDIRDHKDSVYYTINTVRIDQILFTDGKRRNRLKVSPPTATYSLIDGDRVVPSKVDQDTITFTGWNDDSTKEFRYTLHLNVVASLDNYQGTFDSMINRIRPSMYSTVSDPAEEAARKPVAEQYHGAKMELLFRPSIDLQNFREQFIPSVTLGMVAVKRNGDKYKEYAVTSELHFRFSNDANGKFKTYANSFVTLSYGQGRMAPGSGIPFRLFPYLSVSYLVKDRSNTYQGETFRIGFGRFFLGQYKGTKLEPAIYFNDAFKNVSPSIRLSQLL